MRLCCPRKVIRGCSFAVCVVSAVVLTAARGLWDFWPLPKIAEVLRSPGTGGILRQTPEPVDPMPNKSVVEAPTPPAASAGQSAAAPGGGAETPAGPATATPSGSPSTPTDNAAPGAPGTSRSSSHGSSKARDHEAPRAGATTTRRSAITASSSRPTTQPAGPAGPANSAARCGCAPGILEELPKFITMLSSRHLDARFCRCALVGSAAGFNGHGLGPEIDGHDTVIRVNRLPVEAQHFLDFGRRTDIFWGEPGYGAPGQHENLDARGDYWVELMHRTWAEARACHLRRGSGSCGFANLVIKGSDVPVVGKTFRRRFPLSSPGRLPEQTALPLGHQSDDINAAAFSVEEMRHVPSNGLHAFLTLAPLCGSLTMYGFDGAGTADGHEIGSRHSLSEERAIMDRLIRGEVRASDFRNSSRPLAQVMHRRFRALGKSGCLRRVRLAPR